MKQKTKILVLFPMWQRPEVTGICLEQMRNFIAYNKSYEIIMYFVLSPEDPTIGELNTQLKKHFGDYKNKYLHLYKNLPLGEKMNSAVKGLMNIKFDYLFNTGSDDLIHEKTLELYKEAIKNKVPVFGINNSYAFGNEKNVLALGYKPGPMVIGAPRMVHKSVLKTVTEKETFYKDDANRGMDTFSRVTMAKYGYLEQQIDSGTFPYVVDIKSPTNINSYEDLNLSYISRNVGPEMIKDNYPKIWDKIKNGFIVESYTKGKLYPFIETRNGKLLMLQWNAETSKGLKMGIFKEVEKEQKDFTTKELKHITTK